ncbi:MAG: hypothetical protein AB1458_12625 [Bacteroidota bacterium]
MFFLITFVIPGLALDRPGIVVSFSDAPLSVSGAEAAEKSCLPGFVIKENKGKEQLKQKKLRKKRGRYIDLAKPRVFYRCTSLYESPLPSLPFYAQPNYQSSLFRFDCKRGPPALA